MLTLLQFIFFFLLGIYLFGLLGKVLLRYWIARQQQKFGEGAYTRTYRWGAGRTARTAKPEGDVTVQQARPAKKKINRNVGDYVDYEEVKPE